MSTPHFVALPRGVQRTEFYGEFGPLSGLVAEPEEQPRGTALLVPGFTGSKEDFLALLPVLGGFGWRAAAIDLRGQFESPGPASASGYLIGSFVDDILAVTGQLQAKDGRPVHLVGHSFGGLVAGASVVRALSGAQASAEKPLTGAEASAEKPPTGAEASAEGALTGRLAQRTEVPKTSRFASLTLLASGPGALPPEVRHMVFELLTALPHTTLELIWDVKEALDAENGSPVLEQSARDFARQRFVSNNSIALAGKAIILNESADPTDALAELTMAAGLPVMVAFGLDDNRWTPAEQDLMARRLQARRFCWPRTAHSPAAEHPDWCAAVLEAFWSDTQGADARSLRELNNLDQLAGLVSDSTGYTPEMELRVPVAATPSAVGRARRSVACQLQAWGLSSQLGDVQLVLSELVTNAVRHGGGPIELLLRTTATGLRIEVFDSNPGELPESRDSSADEPGGRGVPLIEALTTGWGVETSLKGKTVWAEFGCGGEPTA